MSDVSIPTLLKHGKEIGAASLDGDVEAQKIYNWYLTSQRIGDGFGISYAEELAKKWIAAKATKSQEES